MGTMVRLFNKSIKSQFSILLFGLTAAGIIIIGFLGVRALLDSGRKTEQTTATSMQARVEQLMVQTTSATADKNSIIFQNIQSESTRAATYAGLVFDNPSFYSETAWKFDQHVSKNAEGKYVNPSTDVGSVYI